MPSLYFSNISCSYRELPCAKSGYVASQLGGKLELIISRRSIAASQDLLDGILLVLAELIGEINLKS